MAISGVRDGHRNRKSLKACPVALTIALRALSLQSTLIAYVYAGSGLPQGPFWKTIPPPLKIG